MRDLTNRNANNPEKDSKNVAIVISDLTNRPKGEKLFRTIRKLNQENIL